MKKKNKIILLIIALLVILSLFFLFYFLKNDKNSLNLQEKQWIEDNKNNVIDISILSNVPGLTYQGKGLVFDYLNYVTKETRISFNPIATTSTINTNNSYSFNLTDKVTNNDILIYTDNYVLISKDSAKYLDLSNITSKKIGILESDAKLFTNKLDPTNTITTYKTQEELEASTDIDSIIMLKSASTKYLIENNLNINFQFKNNKYYVITLKGNSDFDSILKKKYNEWSNNYSDSYNSNLLKDYYSIANISDAEQTTLKSRKYTYGFVINGIYDYYRSGKLSGKNQIVMKNFSNFAGVTIKYKNYNNNSEMIKDFNSNKLDVLFNNLNSTFNKKTITTSNNITSRLVLISSINKKVNINNINDLKGKTIYTVKDSYLENYLKKHKAKVKTYDNLEKEIKNVGNNLILMDLDNYDFYKTRELKNCKIDYVLGNVDYNYIVKESELFSKLFNFYINYINLDEMINNNYKSIAYKTIDYTIILLIILVTIIIITLIRIANRIKKLIKKIIESRKDTLTKEDKLKYIDQLTSLKNRAYLNSKVEQWDESETYPQCIIVVDLNNVAYINDNYGREEGDNVIRQAANVLIQTQLPNTEIIRTDGNEFLIYAVGYKEKDIVTYLRKLSKALKTIEYGYGAAIGYSMITDEIKTFDDAVNEATLEMKQSKETTKEK